MATQITATLPTLDFPLEADYPTQEDWAAFSAAAELNFGILGGTWSTQMQLWKTEANEMSVELNNNSTIAQGLANYQGDWTSRGYTLGQTVSVSGIYYICKLTHATGQNPSVGGSIYWNLALGNWNLKVDKVTSTDNAITRFNTTTGAVQNSTAFVDDNGFLGIGIATPTDGQIHVHRASANSSNIKFTNTATGTTFSDGFFIGIDADRKAYIQQRENTDLIIGTNNLTKITIAGDGTATFTNSPIIPTPTTGDNTTKAATTAFVANTAIGVNQTWQDVTASRVSGTTYTNTTGKPIMILISWTGTVGTNITATINGLTTSELGGTHNLANIYVFDEVSIIVPNNQTYIITNTGGTIRKWLELR